MKNVMAWFVLALATVAFSGCGIDSDGDGTPDYKDKCPLDPNKNQPGECGCGIEDGTCSDDQDSDGDGTPDKDDQCPLDPNKIEPAVCGCGIEEGTCNQEQDTDGDGTPDKDDGCPQDPNKIEPGECGCGKEEGSCTQEVDSDGDGTPDKDDGCAQDPNKIEAGICGCGKSDKDSDNDGTADCNDNCPNDPDKIKPGECGCGVPEGTCSGTGITIALNPYDGVNWSNWNQYKANYHTHTTESDGDHDPDEVIDQYHSAGYEILAITDHDTLTWPWTDYNRDPEKLNMLAVRGDEYSRSHHMNAFYSFSKTSNNLDNGIPHVQSSGGLSHFNHPGRYNGADKWAWYVKWFKDYPTCVGTEVVNRTTKYRQLWDNINENLYPSHNRFAWGFANDDKHGKGDLYRAFNFMIMPQLTPAAHKTSMKNGAFYFCSEPGGSGQAKVPRITQLVVDNAAQTITISAKNADSINWMGPGTAKVGTGETFDFSNYENKPFVRAELKNNTGVCYTQPFGIKSN